MTTMRAVVRYAVDATSDEKVYELSTGIADCAVELAELGIAIDVIEGYLDDALSAAEEAKVEAAKEAG